MPSRSNPNVPTKQKRKSNRAKVQKRNSVNQISKNPRGTSRSSVLHPTSGPLAPVSSKKARKLESARVHALKRALEQEMKENGEVEMTDAPKGTKSKKSKTEEEAMEVDGIA